MRRVIAQRLTEAKRNVPHYYLSADVSVDALLKLRAQVRCAGQCVPTGSAALPCAHVRVFWLAQLNEQSGQKLSVNDFIIKAAALALRQVPAVNSSWLESAVRAYDYVDISVAVAVEDGTCRVRGAR